MKFLIGRYVSRQYFTEYAQVKSRSLVPFIESTQFRLCSLAHAARQNAHPVSRESFTINYADVDLRSTFHRYNVKAHGVSKYDEIGARMLGCAINRKSAGQVEFYLHDDAEDSNGLFILEKIEEAAEGKYVLTEYIKGLHFPVVGLTVG